MPDVEPALTPDERLLLASVYLRLTSKDVLRPQQHTEDGMNQQVERSHISVSHSMSHNQSHNGAE
ncbi:Uncharacterised protein [Mycobacteroides abscessus subsp. abscessus]|nr:Uncharacterised protein [Mycobacteroides abscessus subsp. abscessus]